MLVLPEQENTDRKLVIRKRGSVKYRQVTGHRELELEAGMECGTQNVGCKNMGRIRGQENCVRKIRLNSFLEIASQNTCKETEAKNPNRNKLQETWPRNRAA
jgi:hypothetical protein